MSTKSQTIVLISIGGLLASLVSLLVSAIISDSLVAGLVAVFSVSLLLLIILIPVRFLPSVALAVMVLLPEAAFPAPWMRVISPGLVVIAVWAIRRLLKGKETRQRLKYRELFISILVLMLIWSVLSVGWSHDVEASAGWIISFLGLVIVPAIFGASPEEARALRFTWLLLGAVLGIYAVIEFYLRSNFIENFLYDTTVQHWSVYRSTATMYHPLYAGMFMAIAGVLGTGMFLEFRRLSTLLMSLAAFAGLLVTFSRGSILSAVVGLATVLILNMSWQAGRRRLTALAASLVVAVLGWYILQLEILQERLFSAEAIASIGQRQTVEPLVFQAVSEQWFGHGAGTSRTALGDTVMSSVLFIENSLLQLLLSLGIPGVALFLLAILVTAASLFSRDRFTEIGALLSYLLCISTFNTIDDLKYLHLLLGAILMVSWSENPSAVKICTQTTTLSAPLPR